MTHEQLVQAVATATGESRSEIRRRGFGVANPLDVNFDPEPDERPPRIVDWDEIIDPRLALFP